MLAIKIAQIPFRQYLLASTITFLPLLSGCTTTSSIPVGGSYTTMQSGGMEGGCADGCTEGYCGAEGCGSEGCGFTGGECCEVPRELRKTALPEYRIEPPDVLLIEAANHLRPASAPILAGEPLLIQVNRTLPADAKEAAVSQQFKTINGTYIIGTDGYVNLGPEYGKVLCSGEPLQEVQRRVETHLNRILKKPQVMVTLPDPTTKQMVSGPHLVRPDGTVGLGIYGSVFVAGMTMTEAKCEIERHLSAHMHAPEVALDILGYNSKFYYVIADGGGAGESVTRIPCTGNETVLDAISQVKGLPSVACKGQIWIARPAPECCRPDQLLHVDWRGIAEGAQTCTNYQMLPGDRLYVKADRFVTFDTNFAKLTAPLERVLGFTILGNGTVRSLQQGAGGFGNNGGGF